VSKKAWIIFAAICVALLAVLVYVSSKDKVNVSDVNTNSVLKASKQSGNIADHTFGKTDSKVILIEYGDFQCPGCGAAYQPVKAVTEKYKDQLTFVFRNFPLASKHPNARAAASAAEAAGLQGKYWEMHDMLFENQNTWGNLSTTERATFFADYAQELGLNVDKFKTDMASTGVNQKINFDQALGKKQGVSGTPSFYLNGKVADIFGESGGADEEKLDKVIVDALKEAGIPLPKE
jgi:protein-disulfide isomerase